MYVLSLRLNFMGSFPNFMTKYYGANLVREDSGCGKVKLATKLPVAPLPSVNFLWSKLELALKD